MRLSEAIRLGAMMRPQVFGEYYVDGGSCAMGAACEAAGVSGQQIQRYEMQWPDIINASCPACTGHRIWASTIVHLNDDHRWTREQIADWVQTIEPTEGGSDAARAGQDDVALGAHAMVAK